MAWLFTMMAQASPVYTISALDPFRTGIDRAWSYAIMADETTITSIDGATAPVGTYILCDTTNRRFFTGQRIWIVDKSAVGFGISGISGAIPGFNTTILDVQPDKIEVNDLLIGVIEAIERGTLIAIPAIDCLPSLDMQLDTPVCSAGRLIASAIEHIGQNQGPPIHSGTLAPEYRYFDDLPVWMPDHNWAQGMQMTYTRNDNEVASGRASFSVLHGRIASHIVDVDILARRAEWWSILRLFDAMKGMVGAFWMVTTRGIWEDVTVAINTNFLQLPVRAGYLGGDFGQVPAIAMFKDDGTFQIVEVVSIVSSSSPTPTTNVTTVQNIIAGTYTKILLAFRARFSTDTLEEEWLTCDLVRSQVQVQQIRVDQSLEV